MNILFIIGNGFDLNLDLNTKYEHFYSYYHSQPSNSDIVTNLKYEISADTENWSDLEKELGKYTSKLNDKSEFDKVFEDIVIHLSKYLQTEEDKLAYEKANIEKIFEYLSFPERSLQKTDNDKLSLFKDQWSHYQWNVNVVTFNYTRTLEKLIGEPSVGKQIGFHHNKYPISFAGIEHIHGFTDKMLVLGVNDISQIENQSFHTNQDILETLVKSDCYKALKHGIDEVFRNKIKFANLACIFGSSLGDTDNIWWELISEQIKRDCNIIIFHITKEKINSLFEGKKASIARKVVDNFLAKSKLNEEEKEKYKSNIFVGINTNMFSEIFRPDGA